LNGTSPVSSGRLLLNGKDVYKDARVLEGMIGNIRFERKNRMFTFTPSI